jgi:hypothetical protein
MQDEKKNGKYKTQKKGLLNRSSNPTLITRNKTQNNIF